MINEIKVGPQVLTDGSQTTARGSRTGAAVTSQAHGKYHEAVSRGNVYMAANQASTTFTLFGTTSATGFILANPTGSGKNLSVLQIGWVKVVAQTTAIENLVLSASYSGQTLSTTTALTTRCALIGNTATGAGVAYSIATLSAAGVIISAFCAPQVSATAGTAIPPVQVMDVAGSLVITPGNWLQIAAGFTNTVAGVGHMIWEEVAA